MLVLTRKIDEAIYVGGEVCIRVIDVRGDRVRIGIEAPRSVDVDREEIYMAKKAVNNPTKKTVGSINSVINARPVVASKIAAAARKEVTSMT